MSRNKHTPHKVFIIAEVGSNWRAGSPAADWRRAQALIEAAAESGVDAVKFQTFSGGPVYVPNAGSSDYLSQNGIKKSINDIFHEMAMPHTMVPRLFKYCRKRKIEFMSSFFSEKDFKAVDPYVRRHKIASYEITHPELISLAAKSKKPLILSTGASSQNDIRWAVTYFKKMGGKLLTLMQCTAKYSAPVETLNLKVIPELAKRYQVSAGLSDHSRDAVLAPVAAVALGAVCIEKHFTLDNKLDGPDHAFALVPKELKEMVRAVRDCEAALGSFKKEILPEEKELYFYAQRAVQALRDISKGEKLSCWNNLAILRPGKQKKGMHPKFIGQAEGAVSKRFIPLGSGVRLTDFTKKRTRS